MKDGRLHSTAAPSFFKQYVYRFPDKQYETWIGSHFANVGIDFTYQKDLADRIAAGVVSHFFDMSLPTAFKHAAKSSREDLVPVFERKFDALEKRFHASSDKFFSIKRPDLLGEHELVIHGEIFLLRLLGSFQAARYLINMGFFSEPLTILRSSLEQVAWCHTVATKFDVKQFEHPEPSSCIGVFKKRFPAAGPLYGMLSNYSHMEFEAQKHFVGGEKGQTAMMQRSTEFKFFGIIVYAFLLISYQIVCRDIVKFYNEKYRTDYRITNAIFPLKYLIAHALMRRELDDDEIASQLSSIYLQIFSPRTDRTSNDQSKK